MKIVQIPLLNFIRIISRGDDFNAEGKAKKIDRLFERLDGISLDEESSESRRATARLAHRLGAFMSDPQSEGYSIDQTAQWVNGGYTDPFNEYHMLKGMIEGLASRLHRPIPHLDWKYDIDPYERALAEQQNRG